MADENTPGAAATEAAAALAATEAAKNAAPLDLGANEVATPNADTPGAQKAVVTDPAKPNDPVVYQFNPTGDIGLDMTLEFLGKQGYGIDHPAMARARQGDFSLIAAELAAKDVKGYERYIALGEKAHKDATAKDATRQAADRVIVEEAVGGPEAWAEIQAWATKAADPEERTAVAGALKAGGVQARMAAVFLRDSYQRATGVSTEGAGAAVAGVKGSAADTSGALSPKEYAAAVAKARTASRSGDFENSREYKALQDRRLRYHG